MTKTEAAGWRDILTRRLPAALAAAAAFFAVPAHAQSVYGCRDLAEAQVPMMEGEDGFFFRIDPDLLNYNRMSDGVVENVAALSAALREKGTTLVFLPMPTKALTMPGRLGPDAAVVGYEPGLAAAVYGDTLRRLREAGVALVDVRHALRGVTGGPAYFRTDPRPTAAGLRALAVETALVLANPASPTAEFRTIARERVVLESPARFGLQLSCDVPLPEVADATYVMEGPEDLPIAVALVGTGLTGGVTLNFAGFLSEASGLRAVQAAVAEDSLAGMLSYLDSTAFRQRPPEFLIWEVPVWANLALRSDQPFRELVAAALDDCGPDLATETGDDGHIAAGLPDDSQSPFMSVRVDAGGAPVGRAEVTFVSAEGERRTRTVTRGTEIPAPGRVFVPLSGLWSEGAASVEVRTDVPDATMPKVALCDG